MSSSLQATGCKT